MEWNFELSSTPDERKKMKKKPKQKFKIVRPKDIDPKKEEKVLFGVYDILFGKNEKPTKKIN